MIFEWFKYFRGRVDMSDQLSASMKMLLTRRKKEALKDGLGEPIQYIFHRNQKPMEQNHIRLVLKEFWSKLESEKCACMTFDTRMPASC